MLTLLAAVSAGAVRLVAAEEEADPAAAEVVEVEVVPRGPLPLGETGRVPTTAGPLGWWLGALAPALLLWTGLAARRAHVGDGTYERRCARAALRRFIKRLANKGGEPTAVELERWCELTAVMMGVTRAAPAATDIARALGDIEGAPDKQSWFTLWHQARQSMYAAQSTLPQDWVKRAWDAIEQTRVLRAASPWPVSRGHWLPAATAMVVALLVFVAPVAGAPKPEQAYAAGEYAAAREGWNIWLSEHPTDWAAHTNLGLTYAQEEAWGGAAAHWTAAYLQAPRHEVVVSNMRLGLDHIDGVEPALRRVVAGAWYDRFFGRFSPTEWQMTMRFAAVVFGLGLCGQVVVFYRNTVLGRRMVGGLLAGSLFLGVMSSVAVHRYGILGNPAVACIIRATDLRSVPSDLVEQQQMAPLLPGRLVIVDGTYFGWVRRGMVLPLYVSPSTQSASGVDPSAPRPPAPEPNADDRRAD